jgi:hypothetical protein
MNVTHGVLLDQQLEVTLVLVRGDGSVRPDDGLALVIQQSLGVRSLGQKGGSDLSTGDRFGVGEGEDVAI